MARTCCDFDLPRTYIWSSLVKLLRLGGSITNTLIGPWRKDQELVKPRRLMVV